MEREDKAKVVASVLGGRICSIPCRASCFTAVYLEEMVEISQSIWKKRLNSVQNRRIWYITFFRSFKCFLEIFFWIVHF